MLPVLRLSLLALAVALLTRPARLPRPVPVRLAAKEAPHVRR